MFWVCILKCSDNSYYTGHTDNLDLRIAGHQHGVADGYTQTRRPVELVFSQSFVTREEALTAEQQIKGWNRKKKEALIQYNWQEIVRLSNTKTVHGSTGSPRTANETVRVNPFVLSLSKDERSREYK